MAGLRLAVDRNDSLAAATAIHLLADPAQGLLRGSPNASRPFALAWAIPRTPPRPRPWCRPRGTGIRGWDTSKDIDGTLSAPTLVVHQVIER